MDNWNSHTGFIHEILEREFLINTTDFHKNEYYLCGPSAMIKVLQETLSKYNIPNDMISFDEF